MRSVHDERSRLNTSTSSTSHPHHQVSMIVGAFSCVILCDGRPLEEYMADLKPGKGRAFIESVTGKVSGGAPSVDWEAATNTADDSSFPPTSLQEFSVQWTEDLSHPEAAHSSIGYVDFDGLVQTNRILHGGETEMIVTGQQVSSTREKPFVFSLIVRPFLVAPITGQVCDPGCLMHMSSLFGADDE